MPLSQIEDALSLINEEADDDATIIFGTVIDKEAENEIKITVIATGFENKAAMAMPKPPHADGHAVGQPIPRPIYKSSEIKQEEDLEVPTFIRRQAD